MRPLNSSPRSFQGITILLLLAAVLQACQPSNAVSNTTPASTIAASAQGSPEAQKTNQGNTTPVAASGWSLSQPAAGLDALTSYHQSFSSSLKGTYQGKPYEASSSVDRRVNGQDESSLLNSTTTGENPFYLQFARLDSQAYVQQKAGQACRAPDLTDRPDQNYNPAGRLPPVFGASSLGSEPLAGPAAVHYRFDASSVRNQAGRNGTAVGDVWVAQDGGAVLKYQLTVEFKDGDFIGTRAWTYSLDEVNKGTSVVLPEGCLPILIDLPSLPGAADLLSIPGFLRYTASSNIDAAVKFFQDQLPAKNWYTLPGDKPQAESALLKFARSMADGSGQVLAVQLAAQGQDVVVVIQIIKTHKPIQAVTPAAPNVTPSAQETTETPGTGPGATLPEGLPVYPGAQVIMQNSEVLMCQAKAPVDQVAKYYQDQMTAAGWSLIDNTSMGGVTTQSWEKGGARLMLLLSSQNNLTQIVFSPQQ